MKQLDEKEQEMLSKEVKRAFQRVAGKTGKKQKYHCCECRHYFVEDDGFKGFNVQTPFSK